MRELTKEEREVMDHALGRVGGMKKGTGRNYYAADPDGPDFDVWERLVNDGLAGRAGAVTWTPLVYFHVTEAGVTALDGDK